MLNIIKHDFDNKELSSATAHKYAIVGTIKGEKEFSKWKEKNDMSIQYKGYDGFTYPVFHLWTDEEIKNLKIKLE